MPKAAAPRPAEWANRRDRHKPFDLGELNRVVRDHAYIDLEAARRRRGNPLMRVGAALMFWVAALGTCGPLFAAGVFVSGGGYRKFSEDFSAGFEVQCIYIGSILASVAVLYFLLPWLRSSHRQWSGTLVAMSAAVAVTTVILLFLIYTSSAEIYPRIPMVIPVWITLALSITAIVADYRLHTTAKPPEVAMEDLSDDDIEVLRASRRQALRIFRTQGLVGYGEFTDLDKSPL
ncbi:hypothetical protein [Nocardioides sp.]|uniref:hypothetical protein n=1 Tax=Nocardioides sp. TaxID=35761 RepID=UPI0019BBCFF5|nr:hypothetical protein [Nocardioides sp.]MBC7277341.1 hypothetical protein [Nocardioides sp.]